MTPEALKQVSEALRVFAGPVAPGLHDEQYITGEFHVRDFRRAAEVLELLAAEQIRLTVEDKMIREYDEENRRENEAIERATEQAKAPPTEKGGDPHSIDGRPAAAPDKSRPAPGSSVLERAKAPPDWERLAQDAPGYADSLDQMAGWVREAVDGNVTTGDPIGLEDIDTDELSGAAALLRRLSPVTAGEWQPTHQHYKGGLYRVIGSGQMEADLSSVVIYENRDGRKWVRPIDDFIGTVNHNGKTVERFLPLPARQDWPAAPQGGGTMSDNIANEMREVALDIQKAAQRTRCYSVIQHIVTAATDHISAVAGNAKKNTRLVELEAERDRLRNILEQRCGGGTEYHSDGAVSVSYRFSSAKAMLAFRDAITALSSPTPEGDGR